MDGKSGGIVDGVPGTITDGQRGIEDRSLPEPVARVHETYTEAVGLDLRDSYDWQWFHAVCPSFRLSTVPPAGARAVRTQKTLLTMYITFLDDLAEQLDDEATFEEGAKIPFARQAVRTGDDQVRDAYLDVTRQVWEELDRSLRDNPLHDDYRALFQFDLRQAVHSMRYALFVNRYPEMANLSEGYAFGSYNMVMFPYAAIDLMYSPEFDRSELGQLRALLYETQQLARIGNWVTTWRRELEEGDISSGVVIRAIEEGLLDPAAVAGDETTADVSAIVDAIEAADIVDELLAEWDQRRDRIRDTCSLSSVDVDAFLSGMERVLAYQFHGQGKK